MSEPLQPKPKLQILRKKEIADVARNMLKGSDVDLSEIQAALHRTRKRYDKSAYIEREVVTQLTQAVSLQTSAISMLVREVDDLKRQIEVLKSFAGME